MYRNARLRISAAIAAIVCLLFSQVAVAAYACPTPMHSATAQAATPAADSGEHAERGDDWCVEHDTARPALCMAHCNPAELSLNHAQADAPPVMLVALYPPASRREPALVASTPPQPEVPLRNHSPPHSILHCCFRT